MKKINYRPVYNRKKQLNAQGTALLQIEAYLDKRKTYFSTGIYLTPEQWDSKKLLIRRHPHAEALNYKVRESILMLEKKELALWREKRPVTLEALKDEQQQDAEHSFIYFVKEDIDTSQAKPSTKKNRMTTCMLLAKYNAKLGFTDITPQFIYDFEKYLFENGCQTNTVAKHMKHLKAFVNSAIDKGHISISNYAFRRYRIKTTEGKHTYLLPEELQKLEGLTLSKRKLSLSHTLDAFLFCCYTGLRYSDFTQLSEKNVVTIDNKPWIIFRTIKTGIEVKLPLSLLFEGKAWKMLRKHKGKWEEFFSFKPNSTANKELIRLGKLAGITKHFSFHSARHTNATLLIHRGVNITTVQKLLGHRNVSTTQIYSEVLGSTIVNDLTRCARARKSTRQKAQAEIAK